MNKEWLKKLASDVEAEYGTEARDNVFGDLDRVGEDSESIKGWFRNFIKTIDELDNKDFFAGMFARRCPCDFPDAESDIKKLYEEAETLEEFAAHLDENGIFSDVIELHGNVLYATKQPFSVYGKHEHTGPFSKACHCALASYTDEPISDVFCHCCTVGYYGNMFKKALSLDLQVEFIDSVISGGKGCTTAIYLPEKH